MWKEIRSQISDWSDDEAFLIRVKQLENLASKALSIAMVVVILFAIVDLGVVLIKDLLLPPYNILGKDLLEIFGLFLNVLIALEILENITAYLRKHVIQVELVIVTSIIAVARKIIILDFGKTSGLDLIGLAIAIFALAVSYWVIHNTNSKSSHHP
ncbi:MULTISPECIES: phosphate-starvation-inducible PsiE family protein [Trichocoleus]|nr:phosphate-starvation-inducible PsiE family protein [Trichocoleus sp. FACHB-46]MBD1863851.1 phosphate-starvation-inducible PsiE family protein [Trichocoleus sp. FACHB-46]